MTSSRLEAEVPAAPPESPDTLQGWIDRARDAESRGEYADALTHYEEALKLAPREGDARLVTQLLRWIGAVHRQRSDIELALELYEVSLAIAEANGFDDQVASCCNSIGIVKQFAGEPDQAETLYRRAKQLATSVGNHRLVAMVDQNLGALANMRGDVPAALLNYTSALFRYRRLGDEASATRALNNMGISHLDLGELDAAAACFDQAYELATLARDLGTLGHIQMNRAELFLKRQQFEQARQCCDDGFAIFTQIDARAGLAASYKFYGILYRETGKTQLADIHLGLAWNIAAGAGNMLLQAEVQHELARVHLEERRHLDALGSLNKAHSLFHQLQASRELLDINHQLDEVERTYVRVVQRWGTEAIESKDPYTAGHSERVAEYTHRLATAIGISGRELTWLRIGAFLHDVGKTVVPGSVLIKPGVLNESEWGMMKQHTLVGDEIVHGLDLPFNVRPMVRSHHERWDGQGYPDRIAGEDIPLEARVLSVADVFDALTTARSYRNPFSHDEARRILDHQAGRALDPTLVEEFQSVLAGQPA
ncbi:MAG TPA: HD domain-containing phosphohydrolase [Longimicrobiales bacterium]|nr:HD domain-containing phosphohydrolase [Longimicrobiales bacterium]